MKPRSCSCPYSPGRGLTTPLSPSQKALRLQGSEANLSLSPPQAAEARLSFLTSSLLPSPICRSWGWKWLKGQSRLPFPAGRGKARSQTTKLGSLINGGMAGYQAAELPGAWGEGESQGAERCFSVPCGQLWVGEKRDLSTRRPT